MGRILTAILSFHWTAVFTLSAVDGTVGHAFTPVVGHGFIAAARSVTPLAVAAGYAIVAVLFLWTMVSALLEGRMRSGVTQEVAQTAFCAAVASLTLGVVGQGVFVSASAVVPFAIQLAALLCTYLVIRIDGRDVVLPARRAPAANTNTTARLMALGAAHRTMLARHEPRRVAANDERER